MALIDSHRTRSGTPRVEVLTVREQPRRSGKRIQPGQRLVPVGYSKHWRPASLQRIVDRCPAEWADCDRLARQAAQHRVAEWTRLFGGLSSGVCRLLMRAAEADADAQYFRVMAEQRDDDKMRGRADQRQTTARQCELMAWEIACRETDRHKGDGPGQTEALESELADGLESEAGQSAVNSGSQSAGGSLGRGADRVPGSALTPGGGLDAGAPTAPNLQSGIAKRRRPRSKKQQPAQPVPPRAELSDEPAAHGPSVPETPPQGQPGGKE